MPTEYIRKFIYMLCLTALSCFGNFAQSADCTSQSTVENLRQRVESAQNDYIAASRKYSASFRKLYEMRTTVHECQSGQTIPEKIFGTCNDIVLTYNALVDKTDFLESEKNSLNAIGESLTVAFHRAMATACKP